MPPTTAQYIAMICKGCPGMFTESHIRYHLPQERGWAYVMSEMLRSGVEMVWPSRVATSEGRFWDRLERKLTGGL